MAEAGEGRFYAPVFGVGAGGLMLVAQGRMGAASFLVFWGMVVVSLVDNIVRPLVVSGRIVLGPVVIALVLALLRFVEEERAV